MLYRKFILGALGTIAIILLFTDGPIPDNPAGWLIITLLMAVLWIPFIGGVLMGHPDES